MSCRTTFYWRIFIVIRRRLGFICWCLIIALPFVALHCALFPETIRSLIQIDPITQNIKIHFALKLLVMFFATLFLITDIHIRRNCSLYEKIVLEVIQIWPVMIAASPFIVELIWNSNLGIVFLKINLWIQAL